MAWQVGNRGLVDATPRVDVDRVDDFVRRLSALVLVLRLVLAGGSKQKAAVGGECQPPEEGC